MKDLKKFNIRVYGLVVYKGSVLVSHENYKNKEFTKFPGGGLEWGESTHDCLIREFKEELNINVSPGFLFHTTESFQISSFSSDEQVVAIYFLVNSDEFDNIITETRISENPDKGELFEWISLDDFELSILSFATDREAAAKLFEKEQLDLNI